MAGPDPRIRYDIIANAQGAEDVERLAGELEKLDDSIDPAAAARAKALADELRQLGAQQAAIERFRELKEHSEKAKRELQEAQQAAQAFGRSLAGTEAPTRAQAGQMERLRDAVRAAKTEQQTSVAALQQQRQALNAAGIDTAKLVIHQQDLAQRSGQLRQAAAGVGEAYRQQAAAATTAATQQVRAQGSVVESLQGIRSQLVSLQGLVATVLGGQIAGGLIADLGRTADAYSNLAGRIKLVTGEGAAFDAAFEGVFDVAQRTSSAIEETGTLFARLAEAGKQIGVSNREALALTETINQATQISGASADGSRAAIQQLIQALQSGVLRGEEFNSVMEQAPRLAKALADGLGVTTAELRKQAEAGRLTADVVIRALQGQAAVVQQEFSKLPPTVGRAIENLSTSWTRYVGEVDKANGISASAAKAIDFLAGNLGTLATVLFRAGEAVVAYKAANLAVALLTNANAARVSAAAIAAETAALGANTAATLGNAAAKRTAAASTAAATAASGGMLGTVGRLGGALGAAALAVVALKDVVVDTVRDVGTWIGEGIAKWQGYGKAIEEAEQKAKAEAEAARAQAQQHAALAQQSRAAADAALGLTTESQKLIGAFDEARLKGDDVAESLGKVAKAMDVGSLDGINAAITALDALAVRGKATATEIQGALAGALRSEDLVNFATRATAAFDGSEQGARRLKIVLDAIADESLRRAGTSADELRTGFSAAATSAINDVDTLAATLDQLGQRGAQAGAALAQSLDKAIDAASTERAVQAVIERWQALGEQGRLTGDQIEAGLAKARAKLDELTPGIRGLREAAQAAGVDFDRLTTGVNKGFDAGIASLSTLVTEIEKAGISAERSGPIIAEAIDQRLQAAQTREEIERLRRVVEEFGAAGKLAGTEVAAALDRVKTKAQELAPAMRQARQDAELLGVRLKSGTQEGERGLESLMRAYERLKAGGVASTTEVREAFVATASAAIKAAGGIVPEWVKVEAQMRGVLFEADEAGNVFARAARQGEQAGAVIEASFRGARGELSRMRTEAVSLGETLAEIAARNARVGSRPSGGATYDSQGYATNTSGERVSMEVSGAEADQWWRRYTSAGVTGTRVGSGEAFRVPPVVIPSFVVPSSTPASRTVNVNINAGARTYRVATDDSSVGDLLGALESAARAAGAR